MPESRIFDSRARGSSTLAAYGVHEIIVTVVDAIRRRAQTQMTLRVSPSLPRMEVLSPAESTSFGTNEYIPLEARTYNFETREPLAETEVSWQDEDSGEEYGQGHRAQIDPGVLRLGRHNIALVGGAAATIRTRSFLVREPSRTPRPFVQIASPSEGSIFWLEYQGETGLWEIEVRFRGVAWSADGSRLTADRMHWTLIDSVGNRSDVGTGRIPAVWLGDRGSGLTPWKVELRAEDPNGSFATTTTTVYARGW